jgi:hypothetical protein
MSTSTVARSIQQAHSANTILFKCQVQRLFVSVQTSAYLLTLLLLICSRAELEPATNLIGWAQQSDGMRRWAHMGGARPVFGLRGALDAS